MSGPETVPPDEAVLICFTIDRYTQAFLPGRILLAFHSSN
jgi:hypothetical protein